MQLDGGQVITVRLIGVDTPETKHPTKLVQCFGPEASAKTAELLPPGARVELETDVQLVDRYGRTLAYVWRENGLLMVNEQLVAEGYALQLTIPPDVKYAEQFRTDVQVARDNGLGLWTACTGIGLEATDEAPVLDDSTSVAPTTGSAPVCQAAAAGSRVGLRSELSGLLHPDGSTRPELHKPGNRRAKELPGASAGSAPLRHGQGWRGVRAAVGERSPRRSRSASSSLAPIVSNWRDLGHGHRIQVTQVVQAVVAGHARVTRRQGSAAHQTALQRQHHHCAVRQQRENARVGIPGAPEHRRGSTLPTHAPWIVCSTTPGSRRGTGPWG